jgi:hypothetical protein
MVLYRRMALALLAVGLVACGEGEGESDAVATDTSNNIGSYSLYIPQALSALPGSPVALGSTDVRSDYGIGTIDIDLYTSSADSASSTRTSGSANNIQLQPLSHLDALSVGTGTLAVSDAFWKNGWNAQGVGVTVIDDFKTQLTNQSPSLVTGPVTINRVKTDTTGGTATASYEQFFRHTPRPYPYRNTLGVTLMTHGDIVAGIAAGDEKTTASFSDPTNGYQISAFNYSNTSPPTCTKVPLTTTLTCDNPLFTDASGVKTGVSYRLAPGIARGASLTTHTVTLGAGTDSKQQWADISGAMTNAKTSKVINLSLGALITNNDLSVDEMLAVLDASPYTSEPDAVFTVAAGNDSGPCNKSESKQIFNGCNTVAVALSYQAPTKNSTLVVGALDRDGKAIAKYSNRAGLLAQRYLLAPGNSGYTDASNTGIAGTSFAAPRVAGAAAILRGMYPLLSATSIANALLLSANKDIDSDGTPDFSGVSLVYGHGKLDLQRAINYLKGDLKLP